ncbi:hypothetical protein [Arthrobacter alpinus]|nr:hypothetical protein [Arthrobacter alpinus]
MVIALVLIPVSTRVPAAAALALLVSLLVLVTAYVEFKARRRARDS